MELGCGELRPNAGSSELVTCAIYLFVSSHLGASVCVKGEVNTHALLPTISSDRWIRDWIRAPLLRLRVLYPLIHQA